MKTSELFEMTHLVGVYTNGKVRARLWQKSVGGYDYEIAFTPKYQDKTLMQFPVSIDEVNEWLAKEGFTLVK